MGVKHIIWALSCLCAVMLPLEAQNKDLSLNTIVIDAGHGGKDAGTVSPDKKTYEKNIALKLSQKIEELMRIQCPTVKVVLTRNQDVFLPLSTRARLATRSGGQLFVSVHVNASARSRTANGFSAYILGQTQTGKYDSYDVNMEVLKRENSVIFLEDDYSTRYKDYDSSPESQIMLQLMLNAYREQSLSFAEMVSEEVGRRKVFHKSLGVMQGNFAVLREASMPAVLLEFGFMTNPDDLAVLRDDKKLDELATAVVMAFARYKAAYDASVSLETESPAPAAVTPAPDVQAPSAPAPAAVTPAPEVQAPSAPAPAAVTPAPEVQAAAPAGVCYGTQVLVSGREFSEGDPFFRGMTFRKIRYGRLNKYVVGVSADRAEAAESFRRIKSDFPDAFFVRISGEESCERERL